MATTMSLSELMVAVRQRADMMPNGYVPSLGSTSYFVTDPELISYINQSYFELYDLMVSCFGEDYFVKTPPQMIATVQGTALYALAADFYKLLGVDLLLGSTDDSAVTLKKFEFLARNRYAVPNQQSFAGVTNLRYRLQGNNLWLTPDPSGGQNIRVWYVPRLTPLAALVDTADGISGWTEYIITDAAIKCMQKQESDVSVLMAQKQSIASRVKTMADTRDAGAPPTVSDAIGNQLGWTDGMGNGMGASY